LTRAYTSTGGVFGASWLASFGSCRREVRISRSKGEMAEFAASTKAPMSSCVMPSGSTVVPSARIGGQ
jgi:hypothetical protein